MAYLGRPGATAPLTAADIPDNSITAAKIVEGTITVGDIGTDAVGTDEIADDAVTGAKIENNPTIAGNLTVSGNTTLTGDLVPSTPLSHRNLIINGATYVAQRGTSSTDQNYQTVDRWGCNHTGAWGVTQSQETLTSGDPYDLGFRKSYKCLTTSNTSDVSHYLSTETRLEGQDIACSGWNYKSASSNITLSFWVKIAPAGTYHCQVSIYEAYWYAKEYTVVADTWTKVTMTIPGNSNLTFSNDNALGLILYPFMTYGTNYTSSSNAEETWITYAASGQAYESSGSPTWMNTTNAYVEITGVQLELGSSATPFEHRSFGDELARCHRYYQRLESTANYNNFYAGTFTSSVGNIYNGLFPLTCHLRSSSGLAVESGGTWRSQSGGSTDASINAPSIDGTSSKYVVALNNGGAAGGGFTDGERCPIQDAGSGTAYVAVSSEL